MNAVAWYAARSSGIVAYLLLSASVVVGILMAGRARFTWPRFAVEDVHRFLGLLTGAFVGIHVFALFVDAYMPFSLTQLLVPGAASYRPFASALGVVALELLLALAITNRYRKRLSYGFWRKAHYLNFGLWILAFGHGLLDGTDTGAAWADLIYVVSGAAVAGLVTWRVLGPEPAPAAP